MTTVQVRALRASEMAAAAELLLQVWPGPQTPVETSLLIALAHAGNYCAGAFDAGGRLVGVCVGFFAEPLGQVLHSHVAGVLPEATDGGVGTALKQHQRQWCEHRGLSTVAWTYDPLVARNAWFNLSRLGARPADYLVDFYADLSDGRNAGQGSDRLLVHWPVTAAPPQAPSTHEQGSAVLLVGTENEPVEAEPDSAALIRTVAVPDDIETVRARDPETGRRWRYAFRDTYRGLAGDGWRVTGFVRASPRTAAHYELERT